MALPDFIRAKTRYQQTEFDYGVIDCPFPGNTLLYSYDGSGEIISINMYVNKFPDLIGLTDSIFIVIDGNLVQSLFWENMIYQNKFGYIGPIKPIYFDGGDSGEVGIIPPLLFNSNFSIYYTRSVAGNVRVNKTSLIGVY